MALQLNKISRGLLQNRRLIANSVDLIANNKELHADCPANGGPNSVPDAVKTLNLTQGSSKSNLVESALIRGYSTKSGKCKLGKCPKFFLEGCECPRPCEKKRHVCKKRPAPYPSYSEACVEELDEDPSECVQCPWRHCPDFHPKWRGYHTGPALNRAPFNPDVPPPVPSQSVKDIVNEIRMYEKPIGPCEKRRRYLEQLKKEQEREECENEKNKRKRKCLGWTEAVARFYNKQNNMDILADQVDVNDDGLLLVKKIYKKPIHPCEQTYDAFEWDPREADYEHKRKRIDQSTPGTCCPKKAGGLAETINMQLDSGYAKCPKRRRQYPDVDTTQNDNIEMPRDCPKCRKESECCNTAKKPRKYKKRPLKKPSYFCLAKDMLDMDGPSNTANGLSVDLDGDVEVHQVLCVKRRKKSCQICSDETWCNYCRKPCTETCRKLRRRGPYKRRDLYGPNFPRHIGRDRYDPPC